MSNKAKKAKQQSLRKQEQTKRLNRVRGMVKNYNLTDAEAEFYYRALNSKETPIDFLKSTHAGIMDIISQFGTITSIAEDEELMGGLSTHYTELHSAVFLANQFLKSCAEDADKILNDNSEAFEALGTGIMDIINCGAAIEGYGNIQDSLAHNAAGLMGTIESIAQTYAAVETEYQKLEQANTVSSYSITTTPINDKETV